MRRKFNSIMEAAIFMEDDEVIDFQTLEVEKKEEAAFCYNSRRWLDFAFSHLESCPYELNKCKDSCAYYEMRQVTDYYRRKRRILMGYPGARPDDC